MIMFWLLRINLSINSNKNSLLAVISIERNIYAKTFYSFIRSIKIELICSEEKNSWRRNWVHRFRWMKTWKLSLIFDERNWKPIAQIVIRIITPFGWTTNHYLSVKIWYFFSSLFNIYIWIIYDFVLFLWFGLLTNQNSLNCDAIPPRKLCTSGVAMCLFKFRCAE